MMSTISTILRDAYIYYDTSTESANLYIIYCMELTYSIIVVIETKGKLIFKW